MQLESGLSLCGSELLTLTEVGGAVSTASLSLPSESGTLSGESGTDKGEGFV